MTSRDVEQGLDKHTPGGKPWRVEHQQQSKHRDEQHRIFDRDGTLVADLLCPDIRPRNAANAAAIVRAVNCHDELLAAAKRALNYIENTEGELGITLDSGNALRAAIAKAEGRAVPSEKQSKDGGSP